MAISLAKGMNPTKGINSNKLIPRLSQMLQGCTKEDPPVLKNYLSKPMFLSYSLHWICTPHVPELLSSMGLHSSASALIATIRDLVLIAFYYLLCVKEYTIKNEQNNTKQTVQFHLKDATFFWKDRYGHL